MALVEEAKSYFALAWALLEPAKPRLVAIGGLSGSGKTTLAEALAPLLDVGPGARIVESDRVRKAMHAVPPETKLPPAAYRPEISARVYREMAWRARLLLNGGGCVIVDAVFDKPRNRQLIAEAAAFGGHRFQGYCLRPIQASCANAFLPDRRAFRMLRSTSLRSSSSTTWAA